MLPIGYSAIFAAIMMSAEGGIPKSAPAAEEYVRSDGFMHERLKLSAPTGNFIYVELGCVGGPTTYEGKAKITTDHVSIEGRHGVLERLLVPVAWGDRRYLVPPDKMSRFCEYASGKAMDEPVPFFLRAEDQSKPVPSTKERPSQCR